jgi:hypothetical protein
VSNISKMYEEIMAKTASFDDGLDADFFHKVASGDDDATEQLGYLIEAARAEGHSDEEIESAIEAHMADAGLADDSGYDLQKAAAYDEGAEAAINDILNSDFAKTAGITADDLVEYELGQAYGVGYAEARQAAEEAIEKIAKAGMFRRGYEGAKGLMSSGYGKAKAGGGRAVELLRGGKVMEMGPHRGKRAGNTLKGLKADGWRSEALKSQGSRAALALGLVGSAEGARRGLSKKK